MRERDRERESSFWERGIKQKKKNINAHIHKIPEMNTWQFYKLAHDISFAHQISCTYSKEKKNLNKSYIVAYTQHTLLSNTEQ